MMTLSSNLTGGEIPLSKRVIMKDNENTYQPKWCEDCRLISGVDCPVDHVPKEGKGKVFHCDDKKPMRRAEFKGEF